ncbi:hypothetical protein B0I35DRAFT_403971 [Stachybotrys elegans]|uniref:SHSP domain-containing protein n=1 Tax=Stachybotrys elegans TaxID=80388 RepID=A0A8K0T2F2_9HYPO|nr:hypothetical protein B0I35DRAFT_403971 [Stachybotrys elegans]
MPAQYNGISVWDFETPEYPGCGIEYAVRRTRENPPPLPRPARHTDMLQHETAPNLDTMPLWMQPEWPFGLDVPPLPYETHALQAWGPHYTRPDSSSPTPVRARPVEALPERPKAPDSPPPLDHSQTPPRQDPTGALRTPPGGWARSPTIRCRGIYRPGARRSGPPPVPRHRSRASAGPADAPPDPTRTTQVDPGRKPSRSRRSARGRAQSPTDKPVPEDQETSLRPVVDVFNTEQAFIVHAVLPGAKEEDIDVIWNYNQGSLTITGNLTPPGGETFLQTLVTGERKFGHFERSITIPPAHVSLKEDVDGLAISKSMADGILVITLPKIEKEWTEILAGDIV